MKIHRAVILLTVGVLGAASGGAVGWLVPDTSAAAPEVEICADSDIPAVVSERVAQVASSLSVEHRRGRCSDPAPMVLRAGYNPNQPELSVSTDRIRRVKAGTPTTRKVASVRSLWMSGATPSLRRLGSLSHPPLLVGETRAFRRNMRYTYVQRTLPSRSTFAFAGRRL